MGTEENLNHCYRAAVVGVSAGGFRALGEFLPKLSRNLPLSICIVQHMSPGSDSFLAEHLNSLCTVNVKFAEDKEILQAGVVYIAPPDYHLLVEKDFSLALSMENRVNYSRPSIDVLFESAAEAYGPDLIGVIMTGANEDGAAGLERIKELGGLTVVQSPATAEVKTMVLSALDKVAVDHVVTLEKLGDFFNDLVSSG